MYEIKAFDEPEEVIEGYFYESELTPVGQETKFYVDKVLQRDDERGQKLVTFRFLPDSMTRWVDIEDEGPFYPLSVSDT